MVRVHPEDSRAADAGRKEQGSAAEPVWPEELRFETDVIPWKSPFQDDPDALERLIRETDGQMVEPGGTESAGGRERTADTGRIRPVREREKEPETAAHPDSRQADVDGPEIAGRRLPPEDREDGGEPEGDREAEGDIALSGYLVRRRRPPAPSWARAIATVAGAVLTGALFGYLVMSLLVWQPGTPPEDAGIVPDGEADIALPAGGSPGSDPGRSDIAPAASGVAAAAPLPDVRYYVLQYGVFSTEAGLAEALAQLRSSGYAAAADRADGFRAYAGIAESRDAAEALAARLDGVELYIRPLDIPAPDGAAGDGLPAGAAEFLLRTNDLIRMTGGLSASLLASGGTTPVPAEIWSDWETAHRSWTVAAEALRDGVSADGRIGAVTEPLGKAAESFAAYREKPSPEHLWAVQSALIEAAVAQRDWMRASGSL